MDRTLTHVRHTRPTESRRTEDKIYQTVSSVLAVLRFLEVIFLGYRLQFGGEVRSRK